MFQEGDAMLREATDSRLGLMSAEIASPERPGRRFQPTVERLLDDDLRFLAARLPGAGSGLLLAPEFVGPVGVADLVAVTRSGPALGARLRSQVPFATNVTDCAVLAVLSARRVHTDEFVANRLGMSFEQARRRLASLTARGMTARSGRGYVRDAVLSPLGRSYSIEAKVSDWRRGLSQALRYSSWSDASAVVLLNPPRDLGEATERFRSLGIGLAVRDRWILKPTIGRSDPGLRLAASERLALSVLNQRPSPAA